MASSAEVSKRRQLVADLWVRGIPTLRIAKQLNVSERTIRDDVAVIRRQLQGERVEELEQKRDRTIAVLRTVQQEAWKLFAQAETKSINKNGALNTVISAEQLISKLEGTTVVDVKVEHSGSLDLNSTREVLWQKIQNLMPEEREGSASLKN